MVVFFIVYYHSCTASLTCPKIALHSNNYKKCTSYD